MRGTIVLLCAVLVGAVVVGCGGTSLPNLPVPSDGKVVTDNPVATNLTWDAIKALAVGTELALRVNRTGFTVHEYGVTFTGFDEAFSERLIVCTTPATLNIGPGDSGSPLMYEGKIVGGLCYGYSGDNHTFYARYVEDVRAVTTVAGRSLGNMSSGYSQLQPQRVLKGASPSFVERANKLINELGGTIGSIKNDDGVSLSRAETVPNPIAGMSVAINESSGPITLGSIGAITCVEQDTMYLFSHELYREGEASSPVVLARCQGLSPSEYGGKLASPTDALLGATDLDGQYGVRVNRHAEPTTYPLTITCGNWFAENLYKDYRFQVTPHNWGGNEADAVMVSLLWSLDDYMGKIGPGAGQVVIEITDQVGKVVVISCNVGIDDYSYDVTYDLAGAVFWTLASIVTTASPSAINVTVDVSDEVPAKLTTHFVELVPGGTGVGEDAWPDETGTVYLKAGSIYQMIAFVPAWPKATISFSADGGNCLAERQGSDQVFDVTVGTCELTVTATGPDDATAQQTLEVVADYGSIDAGY